MSRKHVALALCLVLPLAFAAVSCKGKKQADTTPVPAEQPVATPEPTPQPTPEVEVDDFRQAQPETRPIDESAAMLNEQGVLKTVYFAFDRSELTDTARATLRQNANWLKANPQWNVAIEGHCDERGTIEYNLALGQRRANTVRDYLASLGVEASRVRGVSYGEERPADAGHTEAAWAKNRRAESKVEER